MSASLWKTSHWWFQNIFWPLSHLGVLNLQEVALLWDDGWKQWGQMEGWSLPHGRCSTWAHQLWVQVLWLRNHSVLWIGTHSVQALELSCTSILTSDSMGALLELLDWGGAGLEAWWFKGCILVGGEGRPMSIVASSLFKRAWLTCLLPALHVILHWGPIAKSQKLSTFLDHLNSWDALQTNIHGCNFANSNLHAWSKSFHASSKNFNA